MSFRKSFPDIWDLLKNEIHLGLNSLTCNHKTTLCQVQDFGSVTSQSNINLESGREAPFSGDDKAERSFGLDKSSLDSVLLLLFSELFEEKDLNDKENLLTAEFADGGLPEAE